MTAPRRKIAALLSASALVVPEAAVSPHVVGLSVEPCERGGSGMPPEHPEVGGEAKEAEEVLSYWFPDDLADADMETLRRHGKRWMAGGPEVDREITKRFGDVLERARGAELDHWAQTPRGRLALIIVLDQFSRNIYRGSPLSYSQDTKALKLAIEGIELGMDRDLMAVERNFFWLPLGHSEDLALHERSVRREPQADLDGIPQDSMKLLVNNWFPSWLEGNAPRTARVTRVDWISYERM